MTLLTTGLKQKIETKIGGFVLFWIIENELSTLECLLRIIISGVCGIVIGIERSRRQKDAGIRTHTIMAMGAALAMIVSKYGFMDMPALDTMRADGSRIASNILTSVGFLGAGVIFTKGGAIKGLTTAAGIWTMAGIGMCIGAGLYTIGIMATLTILGVQIMFHIWKFVLKIENIKNILFLKKM